MTTMEKLQSVPKKDRDTMLTETIDQLCAVLTTQSCALAEVREELKEVQDTLRQMHCKCSLHEQRITFQQGGTYVVSTCMRCGKVRGKYPKETWGASIYKQVQRLFG